MTIPFPRPTDPFITVERAPVEGRCPDCGAAQLRTYPVLGEEGWLEVVKCAACLTSVERRPGPALGPAALLSDEL